MTDALLRQEALGRPFWRAVLTVACFPLGGSIGIKRAVNKTAEGCAHAPRPHAREGPSRWGDYWLTDTLSIRPPLTTTLAMGLSPDRDTKLPGSPMKVASLLDAVATTLPSAS